jgi:hypothetical protein
MKPVPKGPKPKSVADTLIKSKKVITPAARWIKKEYNRGDNIQFCAIGALQFIDGKYEKAAHSYLKDALREMDPEQDFDEVENFNDYEGTSHRDVLRLFDRAIAIAKKYARRGQKRAN